MLTLVNSSSTLPLVTKNAPPAAPGETPELMSYDDSLGHLGKLTGLDTDFNDGRPYKYDDEVLNRFSRGGADFDSLGPIHHTPTKKDNSMGGLLPILLLGFFGCFMYQQYQKSKPNARGMRAANNDHEEGMGLMDFCRGSRSALGNKASDMLDRRRDKPLTGNDYGRGGRHDHEEDDDGML